MTRPEYLRNSVCTIVLALSLFHATRVNGEEGDPGRDVSPHMRMTAPRPVQPGDQQRADAIVTALRKFMDQYTDYRKARAAGFEIVLPGVKQPGNIYHFGHSSNGPHPFDPGTPSYLLYLRTAAPERYKLIGAMYTAPYGLSEEDLNRLIPLSIGRWHLHVNFCLPPMDLQTDTMRSGAKFGYSGSIATEAACSAAGGIFLPHMKSWMLHVYPYETDAVKIWGIGSDDGMQGDDAMSGMMM